MTGRPPVLASLGAAAGVAGLGAVLLAGACGGPPAAPSPIVPDPPVANPPPNTPPAITSLTLSDSRPEVGATVDVAAVVEDQETAPAQLEYVWTAEAGTFSGEGAAVKWLAPSNVATPVDYSIGLTVVERYTGLNASGQIATLEHRVSSSTAVRVHDSPAEIAGLTLTFLREFSDSSISAEQAVRNFTDSCAGKQAELEDIRNNRATRRIESHTIGTPAVEIRYGGVCEFRSRPADACVATPVRWESVILAGGREVADGISRITAVYEERLWRLCDSQFEDTSGSAAVFVR